VSRADRSDPDLGVDVQHPLLAAGGPNGAFDAERVGLDIVVIEGPVQLERRRHLLLVASWNAVSCTAAKRVWTNIPGCSVQK